MRRPALSHLLLRHSRRRTRPGAAWLARRLDPDAIICKAGPVKAAYSASDLDPPCSRGWQAQVSRAVRLLSCAVLLAGCAEHTVYEYAPLVLDLDGASELQVSTYPAGFPRKQSGIPFLFKSTHSPEAVYLQMFVRDREKKVGPNAHVRDIRVHELTVEAGDGQPVVAIKDYDANFWMQDNPRHSTLREPIPFVAGTDLSITAHITLNGREHRLSGSMSAHTRTSSSLLILHAFR
jgi:hypothetical protein